MGENTGSEAIKTFKQIVSELSPERLAELVTLADDLARNSDVPLDYVYGTDENPKKLDEKYEHPRNRVQELTGYKIKAVAEIGRALRQ